MSYIAGFLTFMAIGGFPSFVEDMKVGISVGEAVLQRLLRFSSKGRPISLNVFGMPAGVPPREVEWALWCGSLCDRQHPLFLALPASHQPSLRLHLLLHGAAAPRLFPLCLLRSGPFCLCDSCGEFNDGSSQCCSQLPHGDHHRSRNTGQTLNWTSTLLPHFLAHECAGCSS